MFSILSRRRGSPLGHIAYLLWLLAFGFSFDYSYILLHNGLLIRLCSIKRLSCRPHTANVIQYFINFCFFFVHVI